MGFWPEKSNSYDIEWETILELLGKTKYSIIT
jgi:hypothetical protein